MHVLEAADGWNTVIGSYTTKGGDELSVSGACDVPSELALCSAPL